MLLWKSALPRVWCMQWPSATKRHTPRHATKLPSVTSACNQATKRHSNPRVSLYSRAAAINAVLSQTSDTTVTIIILISNWNAEKHNRHFIYKEVCSWEQAGLAGRISAPYRRVYIFITVEYCVKWDDSDDVWVGRDGVDQYSDRIATGRRSQFALPLVKAESGHYSHTRRGGRITNEIHFIRDTFKISESYLILESANKTDNKYL